MVLDHLKFAELFREELDALNAVLMELGLVILVVAGLLLLVEAGIEGGLVGEIERVAVLGLLGGDIGVDVAALHADGGGLVDLDDVFEALVDDGFVVALGVDSGLVVGRENLLGFGGYAGRERRIPVAVVGAGAVFAVLAVKVLDPHFEALDLLLEVGGALGGDDGEILVADDGKRLPLDLDAALARMCGVGRLIILHMDLKIIINSKMNYIYTCLRSIVGFDFLSRLNDVLGVGVGVFLELLDLAGQVQECLVLALLAHLHQHRQALRLKGSPTLCTALFYVDSSLFRFWNSSICAFRYMFSSQHFCVCCSNSFKYAFFRSREFCADIRFRII